MDFSKPIIICDANEEFRIFLREILIRNGFFHIVEISDYTEALEYFQEKKYYFALIHITFFPADEFFHMNENDKFFIFSNDDRQKTTQVSAQFGVDKVLTPPFHSKKILEKIEAHI